MPHNGKKKDKKIIKKDGETELFNPQKLCDSMVVVGASENLAQQVCGIIEESIDSNISTDTIFTTTHRYLSELNPGIAAIYSLQRGLSALGPSGFLFEQYVAEVLRELGYNVQTNLYLKGEGVSHEIDVLAEKGNLSYIIEAKYRNDFKAKTHINQVMYADARFQDIKRQAKKTANTREFYMWVVTNTEFTDSAINYVKYRDLQLIGWSHPKFINLKKIVHEKKLYPVTVLPSITKKALKSLSSSGTVLVKQIAHSSAQDLQEKYNITRTLANKLSEEIKNLMD